VAKNQALPDWGITWNTCMVEVLVVVLVLVVGVVVVV
jgi:hypothetical protein